MKFVIDHLSKRFESKEVLRDITFTFEEGKISLAKTTLVRRWSAKMWR